MKNTIYFFTKRHGSNPADFFRIGHHSTSLVSDVLSSFFFLQEKGNYKTRERMQHCQCSDDGLIVAAQTKQW